MRPAHVRTQTLKAIDRIALWPADLDLTDATIKGRQAVLDCLLKRCRAERRRSLAGHWTYCLPRHRELICAYYIEAEELAELQAQEEAA